ncbi:macrophage migration inhibitory factor homolog isoform X1 [Juglans microcarpa x Juglans regia]|uniref:macrophage migration inhibitory factor homolog isoform X1 n=1 Tax=Juglans microcarpa x Juglans regia TaxID=2249226 RepID=UPI001B7DA631|nr:macrophage migration inhibitory factor homolog isoform X1 [Juglans microcarpa x Juglans regia]
MPCLNISTNVSLEGVDTSSILSEATSIVAKLIGKPEAYVMIVLKGSVPMSFGGTEQPAAYGELVSIGGLNPDVNKKLSAAIATILESKLKVPKSRYFLKFYDSKASYLNFPSCHEEGSLLCTSFFSLHFSILFRHTKPKHMLSVCMLYTRVRSRFQLWMEWLYLLNSR